MRRTPFLLATVSLVVVLSACGSSSDPDAEELQADITEELQDLDPELTEEQAECMAGHVIAEVGEDELNDLDFSAEDPDDLEEEFAAAAVAARDDCLTSSTSSTTADGSATSSSAPQ